MTGPRRYGPTAVLLAAAIAATLPGCAASSSETRSGTTRSQDATELAQAVLEEFFDAYGSRDVDRFNSLVTSAHAGDELRISRLVVEYIKPVPLGNDQVPSDLSQQASRQEVRLFRAPIRLWGSDLSTEQGEVLGWQWWVVRGADGRWRVHDWGY